MMRQRPGGKPGHARSWWLHSTPAPWLIHLPVGFLTRGNDRTVDGLEDRSGMVEEDPSPRQQRHTPRRAPEQWRSELGLERSDLAAERWLRHMESLRSATDVALLGDGDEVVDLGQAHPTKLPQMGVGAKARSVARPDRQGAEIR